MSTKTITLAGSEIKAEFSGSNAWLRNDSTDVIYAAAKPGITAGADGVVAIPAGQSAPVYSANGAVWLLGTGSVQLIGSDYDTNPFKSTVTTGSVTEQISRAVSNPNLLINPDFAVNQRGLASYSGSGIYTVDRWKIGGAKLTVNGGFVTLENTTDKGTATFYQLVENPAALSGKTVALSFDYDLKTEGAVITIQAMINGSWSPAKGLYNTGRNVKSSVITLPENLTELRLALIIHTTDDAPFAEVDIYGAKLELGEIATPIVPADPATELAKCQRYYQVRSTGDISAVDLRPSMRANPTVTQLSNGNYAYSAEI